MAAGPQPPMGGGGPPMGGEMGGPPPPGGEGGMSPQLAEAAQAIMGIQDPAELAVLGQLIMQTAPTEQMHRLAVEEGMTTLRQDGIEKALAGITTLAEVVRVTMD